MAQFGYTSASCFLSYVMPHILFLPDVTKSENVVRICGLAWNIGLVPDPGQREDQIHIVWKLIEADALSMTQPAAESELKDELRILVELKRLLFPWMMDPVTGIVVERRNDRREVLIIEANGRRDEIVLAIWPQANALPSIIEVLRGLQENTARQFDMLDNPMVTRAQLSQVVTPDIAATYCVQRADILSHRRMLMVWRENQQAPSVKRIITHWLGVLNDIERDTIAVLRIIAEAMVYRQSHGK
jgi:hypothetical protein